MVKSENKQASLKVVDNKDPAPASTPSAAELNQKLANARAKNHIRELGSLAHELESFLDKTDKLLLIMINDGSLNADIFNDAVAEGFAPQKLEEIKELISLCKAVRNVASGDIEIKDLVEVRGSNKRNRFKSGRLIMALHTRTGGF